MSHKNLMESIKTEHAVKDYKCVSNYIFIFIVMYLNCVNVLISFKLRLVEIALKGFLINLLRVLCKLNMLYIFIMHFNCRSFKQYFQKTLLLLYDFFLTIFNIQKVETDLRDTRCVFVVHFSVSSNRMGSTSSYWLEL